jgi:1-acyl-sn-glycerol-3-phosphate acyltransferase
MSLHRFVPCASLAEFSMWAWFLTVAAAAVVFVNWRRSGLDLLEFLGMFVIRAYARLWHGCVFNRPLLPDRGPAILVSNHTCSADPALLTCGIRRPVSFLIAQEFYRVPVLGYFFVKHGYVPVQRNGRDVCSVRRGLRRLSEGRILCIFPEGGLSYAGRGKPGRGKAGVALLALRSRIPVFPVRVSGGPQTYHMGQAWMWPSRARVTFGPPVDLSAYYDRPIKRKLLEEVTALLMKRVAELRPPTHNDRGGRHDYRNSQ